MMLVELMIQRDLRMLSLSNVETLVQVKEESHGEDKGKVVLETLTQDSLRKHSKEIVISVKSEDISLEIVPNERRNSTHIPIITEAKEKFLPIVWRVRKMMR